MQKLSPYENLQYYSIEMSVLITANLGSWTLVDCIALYKQRTTIQI